MLLVINNVLGRVTSIAVFQRRLDELLSQEFVRANGAASGTPEANRITNDATSGTWPEEFRFIAVLSKSVCSASSTIFVLIVSQQSGLKPRCLAYIASFTETCFYRRTCENVPARSTDAYHLRNSTQFFLVAIITLRWETSPVDTLAIQGFCIISSVLLRRIGNNQSFLLFCSFSSIFFLHKNHATGVEFIREK